MTNKQISDAKEVIAYYTLTAMTAGAVPVPASSTAIIAQNAIMIAHVSSKMGMQIDVQTVMSSMGIATSLNVVAKNLFIEGAKLLSWGTGSIWALAALSAFGATTAGIQTYTVGMIVIEICKNNGRVLDSDKTTNVIELAQNSYDSFTTEWKSKTINVH